MAQTLYRRGFDLGLAADNTQKQNSQDPLSNWQAGKPVLLPQACAADLKSHQDNITQSFKLYSAILEGEEADILLSEAPYASRLEQNFESLGSSMNEGDDQEIETVLFDAINPDRKDDDEIIAEDLWMKASWLSFHEEDASLRFRFSFGVDLHEDVALDKERQHYASLLTEAVFPESNIITQHAGLENTLKEVLDCESINFVERIVYFNSPGGGAYLHHDRERGHAGVIFAQLSGSTFWLALSKQALVQEVISFVKNSQKEKLWPESINTDMQAELIALSNSETEIAAELESFANSTLIHLINETQEFVQQLIKNGHSRTVNAGDMLLLPQETDLSCCWHSVFTLGEAGQALSFAIRK